MPRRTAAVMCCNAAPATVAASVCCFVQVVKARGEAMAAAAAQGQPHGMLSVIGVTDDDLTAICAEARAKLGGDTVCQIANFLFPQVTCQSFFTGSSAPICTMQ